MRYYMFIQLYFIYFCAHSKSRVWRQYKHFYSNSTTDKLNRTAEIFFYKVGYFASCKNPSPIYLPSKIKGF